MIIYEVYGKPEPWAAPKKSGNRFYSTKTIFKEQVIWQLKPQKNHETFRGPLRVDINFFMPIPASTSGIRKKQMLAGLILPICKPDRSNMLKFVEDCLEGAGVISNDSIIVSGETTKMYGIEPKTIIRITAIAATSFKVGQL